MVDNVDASTPVASEEVEWLAQRFETHRGRLRSVAYRMLGSMAEADDVVQESWLRLSRQNASGIEDLGAWLTTVVARLCLDVLRARRNRREDLVGEELPNPVVSSHVDVDDPEQAALLADSVELAMLVVLDRLNPSERLAFVLHDVFDVPFDEIAPIVDRTPAAARQLASRARRRVRTASTNGPAVGITRQRELVQAFLAAARSGDFEGLLAVLDPDVRLRADLGSAAAGRGLRLVRGARDVAAQARAFSWQAERSVPAVVNGGAGLVVCDQGNALVVLSFRISGNKITEIDIVTDPERLRYIDVATLRT